MAIARIEPTGCTVHKGKIQLRFSFYLEPTDPRYGEHHILIPIIPPEGYLGEVDAMGSPVDEKHYVAWVVSLPMKWQTNPFHNHLMFLDSDTTNEEIERLMAESLEEFFAIWSNGEDILEAWRTKPLKSKKRFVAGDMSAENIQKCQLRVKAITKRGFEV